MMVYIIPTILVATIGALAGIMLTIAAKIMFVPVDERIEACTEALPGANCGGCGYAGCSDYAAAVVNNDVSLTLCPVGGPDVVNLLGKILGKEAAASDGQYAIVKCAGYIDKTSKILEYKGINTCTGVKSMYNGDGACQYGCLGMGDCVEACKFNAIGIVNGVAWVDRENCVGCTACAAACPNKLIDMVPKKNLTFVTCSSCDKGAATKKACQAGCIGCKKCEKICKFDAIHVKNNIALIDAEKCKNCGMCVKECPTSAILKLPRPKKTVAAS